MPKLSRACVAALLWSTAAVAVPVVATRVSGVDSDKGIVVFPVGRGQGVALDDPFWIIRGETEATWGRLYYVDETGCAGRIEGGSGEVQPEMMTAIALHGRMSQSRELLPPGATLHATVQRTPPGRGIAWVDLGAWSGLKQGDSVLIERKGIPIARGEITLLEAQQAMAVLTPLLTNARAEAGDHVRLWPAPFDQRAGRLDTVVMDVQADLRESQFRFVAPDHESLTLDRVGELYRGRKYIGLALVTEVGSPLSRAKMDLEVSLPKPDGLPRVGDRMLLRSDPPRHDIPLEAAVFRVERLQGELHDYALIAAGEQDGVRPGDRYVVYHRDANDRHLRKRVAELVIKNVKISYSGAEIHDLIPADDERVQPWDMAERVLAPDLRWENIGVVTDVDEQGRVGWADVDDRVSLKAGEVVRWEADPEEPVYAAVVLRQERQRLTLWLPHGWGPIARLLHAGVDARGEMATGDP